MSRKIEIIGLGGGDIQQLPLGIYQKLCSHSTPVFARTKDHPVIETLQEEGVTFIFFDQFYEQTNNFQEVYEKIVQTLLNAVKKQDIVYAVPGHPMVAEKTVQMLLDTPNVDVQVIGGQSYLDDLFTSLRIDPIEGFQMIDATDFERGNLNYLNHLVFCQVYDVLIASEVKLTLLEDLPADYSVVIVSAAGSNQEKVEKITLEQLDRYPFFDNLTSIYIPPATKSDLNHTFQRLREVIAILRGPNGCAWDRQQTHESLKRYLLEEAYELFEAIDDEDDEGIIEELGDVLLQVMLHSQIGEDAGYFSIDDVIRSVTNKMIERHPHVFSGLDVTSIEEIHQNWQEIKNKEKKERTSLLDGIPKHLPALLRAYNIQKKAKSVNFDWKNVEEVWEKFTEELEELNEALRLKDERKIEEEFGDLFFTLVNIARHYTIDPEMALQRTNQKFIDRFQYIEVEMAREGKSLSTSHQAEMDQYWEAYKRRK